MAFGSPWQLKRPDTENQSHRFPALTFQAKQQGEIIMKTCFQAQTVIY